MPGHCVRVLNEAKFSRIINNCTMPWGLSKQGLEWEATRSRVAGFVVIVIGSEDRQWSPFTGWGTSTSSGWLID
jgi:hypothetical protein